LWTHVALFVVETEGGGREGGAWAGQPQGVESAVWEIVTRYMQVGREGRRDRGEEGSREGRKLEGRKEGRRGGKREECRSLHVTLAHSPSPLSPFLPPSLPPSLPVRC